MAKQTKTAVQAEDTVEPTVEVPQVLIEQEPVYAAIGNSAADFIPYLKAQVQIDNGTHKPHFDFIEAIGEDYVVTKHESRHPFWQVKAEVKVAE